MSPEEWFALDFPYTDQYEYVWVDPTGFRDSSSGHCFICKTPTDRIDIDWQGYYCGSDECEETIRKDLERANGTSCTDIA